MELKDITILYVEDDPSTQMMIRRHIERRTARVVTANNGLEGLEMFGKCSPHVVITDMEMPVMNGREMINRMLEQRPETPIIITSAYDDPAHKPSIACKIFIKPIDLRELMTAVAECVKKV